MSRSNVQEFRGHPDAETFLIAQRLIAVVERLDQAGDDLDRLGQQFRIPRRPRALRSTKADARLFMGLRGISNGFYTGVSVEALKSFPCIIGVGREAPRESGKDNSIIADYWEKHGRGPIVPMVVEQPEAKRRVQEIVGAFDVWEKAKARLRARLGIDAKLAEMASLEREQASLSRKLFDTKPVTPAGLRAKIGAIYSMIGGDDTVSCGFCDDREVLSEEVQLMRSLMRDLVRSMPPTPSAPACRSTQGRAEMSAALAG